MKISNLPVNNTLKLQKSINEAKTIIMKKARDLLDDDFATVKDIKEITTIVLSIENSLSDNDPDKTALSKLLVKLKNK